MKTRTILAAFLVVLAVAWLPAQSNRPAVTNQSVAPGEPEIVMPQVILQIEDLSVEKVQAQLPPGEDLLPPERKIPVLNEGELAIGEPTISAVGVPAETAAGQPRDRSLSAEIVLGAGSQNRIEGSLSLKTVGRDPRFSLLFSHETLDGFSGNPPGAGFSLRNDILDGSLKFRLGSVDTALGGSFRENETGLQNQPPYVARLGRNLSGTAVFSATPLDWLTLNAGVEGGTDSLTLKGTVPLQLEGVRITPSLSAQARVGPVKFGLETRYSFREDPSSAGGKLQRFLASASFAADLPATFILEGAAGWFGNDAGLSRVPFSITFTGTPFDFLTLTLGGGYRVTPYDMHDVLAAHPLALPTGAADDRGWVGDASFQLTLTRDLAATLKLAYMASEALPMGAPGFVTTQDLPGSGLFRVFQGAGNRLSSDVGFRWGISPSFSLSAGWEQEYMDRPFFTPLYTIDAELVGLEPAGRFGGSFSVSIAPTVTNVLQLPPVFRISGFWKVSEAVKLQLEGDDLLGPLLRSPRFDISPFVTPGFRITGSLGMSL
jgi:hypothetical protein